MQVKHFATKLIAFYDGKISYNTKKIYFTYIYMILLNGLKYMKLESNLS